MTIAQIRDTDAQKKNCIASKMCPMLFQVPFIYQVDHLKTRLVITKMLGSEKKIKNAIFENKSPDWKYSFICCTFLGPVTIQWCVFKRCFNYILL